MIVVTGAAGFIGANLVKGLNDAGYSNILAVDDLTQADKIRNLADCVVADYMDKIEFKEKTDNGFLNGKIKAIFHEGACSDTMASDGRYVMENNYRYTRDLYTFCQGARNRTQFIYASSASVYGAGREFSESPENELPLNAYAYSKYAFDNYVRLSARSDSQVVGLRYFNVYGPREQHKGRMASVAYHFFNQYIENGKIKLFEGSDGYANGDQLRDFVAVEDVVKVNLYLLKHPQVTACVLNVGTGQCRSFNDVAMAVINSLNMILDKPHVSYDEVLSTGVLSYIPMPEALKGKYQSYTEADIHALRSAGYDQAFDGVDDGVGRYVRSLWNEYQAEHKIVDQP
jgi:ADP-L-glycero-D-manno-heptose 6-epimerase